MPGRRQQSPGLSPRARVAAGATALAVTGTALAIALVPAGAASAKTPTADYHSGSDKAVFTVTGVEDSNCLVSVGGSTVYIKPGDRIDFSSALAGVSLAGMDLQGGQVAGLNVHAKIDGGASKGGRTLSVPAGKTVKIKNLASGTHTLTWSAQSVGVHVPAITKTVTGLLGKVLHKTIPAHDITIPLSSSQLKSGAKTSWSGKIFVTKNAAKCTLSVQTPKTNISAGPIHATIPGQKVTIPGATLPTSVPSIPDLTKSKSSSPRSSAPKSSSSAPGVNYTPPALTVPEMVVPQGDGSNVYGGGGSGGYHLGLGTDNGSTTKLANGSSSNSSNSGGSSGTSSTGSSSSPKTGKNRTVDLASDPTGSSVSGELPVLLAIIAVIVLAMVAGTYARLYLLGRKQ